MPPKVPNAQVSNAQALGIGIAAYKQGAFEKAWQMLSGLDHAQALNVAGASAQRLGRFKDAAAAFETAGRLAPNDPDIANNSGHLAFDMGHLERARADFSRALSARPNMGAARIGLAKVAAARSDWPDALQQWTLASKTNPNSAQVRYGLGTALLETGDAESALGIFSQLQKEIDRPEIAFMKGRCLVELDDIGNAQHELQRAHIGAPSVHSLRALANLHWMLGDTASFHALIDQAPPALATAAIKIMLEAEEPQRAKALWDRYFSQTEPGAEGWTLAAQIARFEGDGTAAKTAADKALKHQPDHSAALDTAIVAALMCGNPKTALPLIDAQRKQEPFAQNWIAHASVAHRLRGNTSEDPEHLNDVDRFVRAYTLDVPEGYGSLEAFNTALAECLRSLHKFTTRPLDQSLRGGTQTARSLLDRDEPVIRAYIKALDRPIRDYLEAIGQSPDHPTTSRNNGTYRFRGMWSVRLLGSGFHEPHVHPEGWISSAYYVAVPEGTEKDLDKAGWINFAEPPYPTIPALDPLKWIAPKPGTLALFPSYMWHGTAPTKAGAERITAPFDLIPG